jgi:multisubunit Na+/H+ antiporter MnhE subunit
MSNNIFQRTANVLTGKKSKFASSSNLLIGLILSLFIGYLTHNFYNKNDKTNRPDIFPAMGAFIATMIIFNMLTREAGITF